MFSVSQANIHCETELRYFWGFGFEIDFCLSLANSREGKKWEYCSSQEGPQGYLLWSVLNATKNHELMLYDSQMTNAFASNSCFYHATLVVSDNAPSEQLLLSLLTLYKTCIDKTNDIPENVEARQETTAEEILSR